jgi:Zn-dependent protease with chaperone function
MLIAPEKILQYEKAAATNPRAYRTRLAIIAILGDLVLTFLRMLPISLIVAAGFLFYAGWFAATLGVIIWLVFLWMGRADFRLSGRALKREQAPALFAELDKIQAELSVAGKIEVRLDDDFNVGATQTRGLFGLIGTRRVLTLGVPLLAVLGKQQVLAIIAHEFGHFSRRHGVLGHWLYQTRVGWLLYNDDTGEDTWILFRAINWYGRVFVPYFSALAFVHSRRCEYEADADAASVVGAQAFAEALTTTISFDAIWRSALPHRLNTLRDDSPAAPSDYLALLSIIARAASEEQKAAWLGEALLQPASYEDTHPRLSERVAALNVQAQFSALNNVAGDELLRGAWQQVTKGVNEDWRKQVALDWRLQHYYFQHVTRALLSMSDADANTLPWAQALTRARALTARDKDRGLISLTNLHEADPQNVEIAAAHAIESLTQMSPQGIALAEDVWQRSPCYRRKIANAVCCYFTKIGDTAQLERWNVKLKAVTDARFKLMAEVADSAVADAYKTQYAVVPIAKFDESIRLFLTAAIKADPNIKASWAFTDTRMIATPSNAAGTPLTIHFIALVLDPTSLATASIDEESVAAQYEAAMQCALPLADEVTVTTFFSTEKQPERFTTANVFIDKRSAASV